MTLSPGTRLGPYEIAARIGVGGMGEVYRATDTNLKRPVAIKVLLPSVTGDPDRLARFQREAEVLAALNHPNIAAIYGLERGVDQSALVMELVEGPTLADRIAQGPMLVDEVLPIAKQIAEALEAAHEMGIVHRDLKPANIKVRRDGAVKVLDFGLAKALGVDAHGRPLTLSNSPTTVGVPATTTAVVLGTAAYMSPEQAKGQPVDRRSDLFAFGAVLYELLTGQPAFAGGSVAEILAAVLHATPAWDRLPADTPPGIRRLLQRCLDKDLRRRLQSAADARLRLDVEADGESLPGPGSAREADRQARRWVPWVAAVFTPLALALAVPAWFYLRAPAPAETRESRLDINTPPTSDVLGFALSPDGQQVVFAAADNGVERLWLRRLDVTTAQPLAGTDGGSAPFWAPDGQSIGFFASGKLKRLDLNGGAPQILADAPLNRGGTWGADGTILFAPGPGGATGIDNALFRVPASGGRAVVVAKREGNQRALDFPQFLQDGRSFLFDVGGPAEVSGIYIGSLDSADPTRLVIDAANGLYLPSGWMLFVRAGTLQAQRLDLERRVLVGAPVAVADGVVSQVRGGYSASATGVIAYRPANAGLRQLTWVDRSGKTLGVLGAGDTSEPNMPSLSPDGVRVAVKRTVQGNLDIWLLDGTRSTRFTFDSAPEQAPVWSPDGAQVAFDSNRTGGRHLYLKAANGTGPEVPLVMSGQSKIATDWSRDGRFLAYEENPGDLWIVPLVGDRRPFLFLRTDFQELEARFSPDGKWVAYKSNESGQYEVYVRPFSGASAPAGGGQWQVSSAGGINPRWRSDGRELDHVAPDSTLMAVPIDVKGTTLVPGAPLALFRPKIVGGGTAFSTEYDVASDGRFLINTIVEDSAPPITIIQNWKPGE